MKRITYWLSIWIFCGLAAPLWAAPAPQSAEELLSRLEARATQLRDYVVVGEGEAGDKQSRFKLYFKQPDLVRIDTGRGQVTVELNGEIRGRLGKGPLGKVSQKIGRNDPRLKDAEGIPFWDSSFAATLGRIQRQIKAGATAALTASPGMFNLDIRSGQTRWVYVIDPDSLFLRENSRWENGKQVEVTRYSSFQPNVGLETRFFQF